MVYEIYNKESVYVTKDGNYVTPEQFSVEHNAIFDRPIAVGIIGRTIIDVQDFDYMRAMYGITSDVSDGDALAIINKQVEIEESESSPLERIAAALEFIEVYLIGRDSNEL